MADAQGTSLPTIERLLQLLLEQSRDHALVLIDHEGMIVGWLAGASHIFGYPWQQMVGRPVACLFTAEDRERGVPEHELAVARADGRADDDRWMQRMDGTQIWVSGVVSPLRDGAGSIVGFGKVMRDRTDVRAQVEAAERRAEALALADRRKGLFLATLAHELRAPLAPLVTASELIRLAGAANEELAYPIGIIERQVQTLTRLVGDLLDVQRVAAGKVHLELAEVRLDEVVRLAVESSLPLARKRAQQLQLLQVGAPLIVEGDADRLHQVVANLLDNAIKYTPERATIWVKTTIEGAEAVVRVEDTGVGIGPDMLPRIFELFTQEESSRGMAAGGLGLGLPLVRELVALHGGTVQVRSEGHGKGSEFAVRLPLRSSPSPTVVAETASEGV